MIHMCILTLKIFELIQWNISRIGFFTEVTPSKAMQMWGMLNWKSFNTLNKGQNRNCMTQSQTKNGCQKKHEWWERPWKKYFKRYATYSKGFWIWTNKFKLSWSKSLDGLPQFLVTNIEKYANIVTEGVLSKSTVVKKHFSRGQQLLEEQYVDIGSIFTKQSDDFFCFKGSSGSSLRKQNKIIFVALTKADGLVACAYC